MINSLLLLYNTTMPSTIAIQKTTQQQTAHNDNAGPCCLLLFDYFLFSTLSRAILT